MQKAKLHLPRERRAAKFASSVRTRPINSNTIKLIAETTHSAATMPRYQGRMVREKAGSWRQAFVSSCVHMDYMCKYYTRIYLLYTYTVLHIILRVFSGNESTKVARFLSIPSEPQPQHPVHDFLWSLKQKSQCRHLSQAEMPLLPRILGPPSTWKTAAESSQLSRCDISLHARSLRISQTAYIAVVVAKPR